MRDKDLNERFDEAYKKSSAFEGKLPQDVMLKFYALYKLGLNQAKHNSNHNKQDMVAAFKANAMFQYSHFTPDECKEQYIKLVEQYIK